MGWEVCVCGGGETESYFIPPEFGLFLGPRPWPYLRKDYLDKLDKHFMHDRTLIESPVLQAHLLGVCLACDQGVQLTLSPPMEFCLLSDRYGQIQTVGLSNSCQVCFFLKNGVFPPFFPLFYFFLKK